MNQHGVKSLIEKKSQPITLVHEHKGSFHTFYAGHLYNDPVMHS